MNTNSHPQNKIDNRRGIDGFVVARRNTPSYTSRQPVNKTQSSGILHVNHKPNAHHMSAWSLQDDQAQLESLPHFDLPRYNPPKHPLVVVHRKRRWLRTIARGGAVFAMVLVLTGGVLFWRGYANIHKVFRGTTTVAALSATKVSPDLLKGEGDGRVNILLLGIGGQNHPGGDLTDTMMVLSVDPVNNKAAMLSIPRDMWVKMPVNYFGAYQKINAAYSSGKYNYLGKVDLASTNEQAIQAGFDSVDQAVSDVLGINISYHALVDFQAFEQAINTVNGVTVNVTNQLYDPTMAWENGNNPVLAAVGVQTMGGKQALNYARSRETSSDFARSERQRQLLVALKEKVLTLGTLSSPTKIDSLLNAFGNNVHTDLSTQAATRLFSIMKNVSDTDVASLSLTSPESLVTTDRVGDASVVRPKAGFNTYSDIQAYVRSQLRDGYLIKEQAPTYVVGASDGLRSQTTEILQSYGYDVTGSNTAGAVPAGITIVDLSKGESPYTLHYLQDRYGIAAITNLPAGVEVPIGTQFVIIAGT